MSFDGSSGYVSVPYASSLNPTGGVTMMAWIRTSGTHPYSGLIYNNSINLATCITKGGWQMGFDLG